MSNFHSKFMNKLDRIDKDTLKNYVLNLSLEKNVLEKTLDSVPDGIVLLDKAGELFFSNQTAKNILMRPTLDSEKNCRIVFADVNLYEFVWQNFIASKRIVNKIIHILKPNPLELLVSLIPIYNESNALSLYLIVIKDLKIDENIEAIRRSENIEALTNLAAGLAHEIGNPLNTINIYLKIIAREATKCGAEKINELISIISDETSRLDEMVRRFLQVTREGVSFFKKGNINEIISKALNFFSHQMQSENISLTLDLDSSIADFYLDSDKLYEAFINIIKNAIEAMQGGGVLNIQTLLKDKLVVITFKDNGIGIEESALAHIFDAYFTTKDKGSGLGLMNVYNIIKYHRGMIHVDSIINNGTTIVVTIPMRTQKIQLPEELIK